MPKAIKLEKVTGVVALSYLVLIPVGAAILWSRQEFLHQDMETVVQNGRPDELPAFGSIGVRLRSVFRGR